METAAKRRWKMHIPKFAFTTDNAAMIAMTGHFKYLKGEFIGMDAVPFARMDIRV
jgi:N6-L-threonylcarbamoyladenine synthase